MVTIVMRGDVATQRIFSRRSLVLRIFFFLQKDNHAVLELETTAAPWYAANGVVVVMSYSRIAMKVTKNTQIVIAFNKILFTGIAGRLKSRCFAFPPSAKAGIRPRLGESDSGYWVASPIRGRWSSLPLPPSIYLAILVRMTVLTRVCRLAINCYCFLNRHRSTMVSIPRLFSVLYGYGSMYYGFHWDGIRNLRIVSAWRTSWGFSLNVQGTNTIVFTLCYV